MRVPLTHWEGESVLRLRDQWGVPALEVHERISSTNDRALELAGSGAGSFSVVIAEEQTEGRGRRGAIWHSTRGAGLWMSVVLPAERVPLYLPLMVGVAVAEAIEESCNPVGVGGVGIKWPNDLMVGGKKLGGILCETVRGPGRSDGGHVVAGIGVNTRTLSDGLPADIEACATSLEALTSTRVRHTLLGGSITRALIRRIHWVHASLDGEFLGALRLRDILIDQPIDSEEHGRGIARGIASDGSLIMQQADGSRIRVGAGSVRTL